MRAVAARLSVSTPALAAGLLIVALGLAAAGCDGAPARQAGGSASAGASPPPESRPAGGGTPGTAGAGAPDLGGLLVQPPGFVPVPDDPLSGPIQGDDDVRNLFADHPEDLAVILGNDFMEGYFRAWRKPVPPPRPFDAETPDTTTVTSLVLRFDTADHARAVHEHFRGQKTRDGYQFFSVPPRLADGYGSHVKLGTTVFTYHYSVSWRWGELLFDVAAGYSRPQPSPDEVIDFAVAQDEACCPS
jgi:hypothetical protein